MNVLVAVLLFLAAYQTQPNISPKNSSIEKRDTQQKTGDPQKNPPTPSGTVIGECIDCFDVKAPRANNEQTDPYDGRKDSLYRAYLWFTIVGVCVALIGLVFLICQTLATRKAANAAKDSADALMGAEQAWLYLWYEKFAHVNYQDTSIGEHELAHHFNWQCENAGKTPAFVTATWSRLIEVRSMDELPPDPDYSMGRPIIYQGDPLRPTDKTPWFTAPLQSTEAIRTFEAIEARHRSRQSFLYAYGYVQYRDVFRRAHIVKFGVVYESEPEVSLEFDHWKVAGPQAYNQYEEDKNA